MTVVADGGTDRGNEDRFVSTPVEADDGCFTNAPCEAQRLSALSPAIGIMALSELLRTARFAMLLPILVSTVHCLGKIGSAPVLG